MDLRLSAICSAGFVLDSRAKNEEGFRGGVPRRGITTATKAESQTLLGQDGEVAYGLSCARLGECCRWCGFVLREEAGEREDPRGASGCLALHTCSGGLPHFTDFIGGPKGHQLDCFR